MNERYEEQEEFTWQPYRMRPFAVWAMRMNRAFEVMVLDGVLHGKAGDWIVRSDDGQEYPVSDMVFRRLYTRREWKGAKYEIQRQNEERQKRGETVEPVR